MAIGTTTALLLAAAAAGAQAYNTNQTAKKQDRVAADGIRKQGETQRQANARLNKTLDQAGKSNLADTQKGVQSNYIAQVQRAMAQANAGLGEQGISGEFDKMAGGAAASNANYGAESAKLLAAMDSGALQRNKEANLYGDTGMDLDVLRGNSDGDNFLTQLKVKGVQRNPYIDLVAGLMGGAAKGGVGGGAGYGGTAGVRPYMDQGSNLDWTGAYGAGGFGG